MSYKKLHILDKQLLIHFTIKRQQDVKIGGVNMSRELAIYLLESKYVYLTSEGRKQLESIAGQKVKQHV